MYTLVFLPSAAAVELMCTLPMTSVETVARSSRRTASETTPRALRSVRKTAN